MRKILVLAWFALLVCFMLPLGRPGASARELEKPPEASASPIIPALTRETSPTPIPEKLRVLTAEGCREMEPDEYLVGVVAAEMPASFPAEALKAQAVAARSYALYCAATGKHGEADVCTDPGCCQAWAGEQALKEKWGGDYARYREIVAEAVRETSGQRLSYEGEPIFAAFHASSLGQTEDSGAVWNPRPYLKSVSSPETPETVPNLNSSLELAPLDFRDTVLSACPQADFTGEPETWLGVPQRDESGRVESLSVGGVSLSGTELRRLFGLRSTAFTLEYREGRFLFQVSGNGHGVGMSQYGAKLMAEAGEDYRAILSHYYPGTVLSGGESS